MSGAGFTLRAYQRAALDAVYCYWRDEGGNPLITLPTGSGKSLIIAALCQELLHDYPALRIGIATHVRELIMQDYLELLRLWPEAPAGIYSAGIGRRDRQAPILFMGVQSVWRRTDEIGAFDVLIIDEAHLVSHEKATSYRQLIDALRKKTPDMRVLGLTATAFRLDTGRLDEGENKIFDEVVYDANVRDLINQGYLCNLRSKRAAMQIDVSGIKKQGGEFVTKELEVRVDQDWITTAACNELKEYGDKFNRKKWLVFCVSVNHATHVVEQLNKIGVSAHAVFGHTPKAERDGLIKSFKAGGFTALVSVMVLGIGFNVPDVDMLGLLRPTASAGLFVQQVGRGLRNAEGKDHCLVLDFGGNTRRHGSIDTIDGKHASTETKDCPECNEICPVITLVCPCCGYVFPVPEPPGDGDSGGEKEKKLPDPSADEETDIISDSSPRWLNVASTRYRKHFKGGDPYSTPTLRVDYRCGFHIHSEWVAFEHHGYAREKAVHWWINRSADLKIPATVDEALARQEELYAPKRIKVRSRGKFMEIMHVELMLSAAEGR
jgi:DNA repair protein RadD